MRCVAFLHIGPEPNYLRSMIESVRECMDWPLVQFTDMETEELDCVDVVVRKPIDHAHLMYGKIEHIRDYPHDEMVILDTDLLVKHDLGPVFQRPFHVAVTVRDRPIYNQFGQDVTSLYRINAGVMFSRCNDFWAACTRFLDDEIGTGTAFRTREYYRYMGDQLAVNVISARGDYTVLELPCEYYNWTPTYKGEESDAAVWHFKGDRKEWMNGDHYRLYDAV